MKAKIHPNWYSQAKITCACGASYVTGSTVAEISVEICAACHPFYTGTQKIIDTARRVERFTERASKQKDAAAQRKGRQVKKARAQAKKAAEAVKVSIAGE